MNKEEVQKEAPKKIEWTEEDLKRKRFEVGEIEAKLRKISYDEFNQNNIIEYIKAHPDDSIKSAEFNLASIKRAREGLDRQKKVIEKQITQIQRNFKEVKDNGKE